LNVVYVTHTCQESLLRFEVEAVAGALVFSATPEVRQGMGTDYTAQVARYACELEVDSIPEEALERAKDVLLDSLGGQLACTTLRHGQLAIDYAREHRGPSEATVVGTDFKTSAEQAAFVNGIQGHGDELDEVLHLFGHASAVLVPGIFAAAEREGADGPSLMTALVVGYDVAGRLGRSGFNLEVLSPRNFTKETIAGPLAIAAALARILDLDQRMTCAAIGLAAEQSSGLQAKKFESEHMNKSAHMGIAARNGVAAAYLARHGYGGVFDIFDSPNNIFRAFAPDQNDPSQLVDSLGERFEILATGFKRFAAGRPMHTAIHGLINIMNREDIEPGEISGIHVDMTSLQHDLLTGNPTLNVNVEYVLAAAALRGQLTWDEFGDDITSDPDFQNLWGKVTSSGDAELDEIRATHVGSGPARVTVTHADGRIFAEQVVYPPGTPQNPMSRDELEAKFIHYAGKALPDSQVRGVASLIMNIETLDDVGELGDALRVEV
jgi:2-methylcitrate dehydratase PrpD